MRLFFPLLFFLVLNLGRARARGDLESEEEQLFFLPLSSTPCGRRPVAVKSDTSHGTQVEAPYSPPLRVWALDPGSRRWRREIFFPLPFSPALGANDVAKIHRHFPFFIPPLAQTPRPPMRCARAGNRETQPSPFFLSFSLLPFRELARHARPHEQRQKGSTSFLSLPLSGSVHRHSAAD